MGRLTNAILQPTNAFAQGHNAPMLDLQNGGQMGYAPDLTQWVSSQAYVRKNIIAILVEAPKGFQNLPNPDYWIGTLRALVELHAMSIEGLQAGLEVDTAENAVGGAGQMFEDFVDVKQARSQPVFRWTEKYGMSVANFLYGWITNLMMDPATKFANVATLSNKPTDMLADMYSMTCAFIEPDPTHTKVVKSWLVTNMYPKSTGEIIGRRDLTAASEPTSYDVNFTGIAQYGLGVDAFCQTLLTGINITGANPYLQQAFVSQIDAAVSSTSTGYQTNAQAVSNGAVQV